MKTKRTYRGIFNRVVEQRDMRSEGNTENQWLARVGKSILVCCALVISSCASVPQEKTLVETTMESLFAESKNANHTGAAASASGASAVPAEVSAALMNNAQTNNRYTQSSNESLRFDISVNQVPARTFFLSLVADSGVNVVAHPEVDGVISLELNNVTVRETLDVTRDVYGYEYKFQSGIYTIYPRKIRTEIFPINYLDVKRVGVTDTGVSIGKISSSSRDSGSGSNSGGGQQSDSSGSNLLGYMDNKGSNSNSGNQSGGQSGSKITAGARVQTLSRTDFWGSLQETLMAIVGGDGDGRMVMTNPQAGMVVVKALPNEISAVRDFLTRSELSIKRQVILETKILEVTLSDGYQAGIDWGAIGGSLGATQTTTGFGDFADVIGQGQGVSEVLFQSVFNVADITQLLNLLETQGHVQVLSSPRISTVNNQKAIIRVGSDEFFVTGLSNSTTTSASSIQSQPEIEFASFFSGIALDVTPQIAEDGEVIIHVHPIVSKVEDQLKEINVGDDLFSLPLALRDIRESDSVVRAKNGQVVVLGGLMQERTVDNAGKRPFLASVPGLNVLFKTREKRRLKTELVILMRPIVVDDNTWTEELERGSFNFNSISDDYRRRAD
ncbi:pilus (MSHA type) biogenesis protein MshL [Teredinibacter waterburyi]|uniref:pilus (MSHA type) biogenesis protein MshL n=1 Tax=Teredinibacter waterburyi TaxID=1500538 RepID=UPI001FE43197|nr:pilus (MSHA type) biogenesis protein MshL [Teredinibacter waterburyi]